MPKHSGLILVFLTSLAGGSVVGGALGRLLSNDLSVPSVMGMLMTKQQTIRLVCKAGNCTSYIPASTVGQFDLCGHGVSVWAAAIGASTMCALLFGTGLVLRARHTARAAKRALLVKQSSADQAAASAPVSSTAHEPARL